MEKIRTSLNLWTFILLVTIFDNSFGACVLSLLVESDSLWPRGLQPSRLLCPWGFSRQEYWSGVPCPPPGGLPDPGTEPRSPTLQANTLPSELLLLLLSRVSCVWLSASPWTTRLPCLSPTPRACSNSCPLSQWCYPTISPTIIPVSSV